MISIIIITNNRNELLKRMLSSLSGLKDYEIIIGNQSKSNNLSFLENNFIKIKNINSNSLSVSRNRLLKYVKGKSVIFLDDDCYFNKMTIDWINNNLFKLKDNVICCKIICSENSKKKLNYRHNSKITLININNIFIFMSCGMIVPTPLIKSFKFSDKFGVGSLYPAGEETELIIRMIKKGIKILYYPSYTIIHPCSLNKISYKNIKNKFFSYGYGLGAMHSKYKKDFGIFRIFIFIFVKPLMGIFINIFLLNLQNMIKYYSLLIGRLSGYLSYKIDRE
jgi:GT2 family glycosyltransferase